MPFEVSRAGEDDYGSYIKILIVGDPGSGKTRHSSCWPDPLILNAEAGLMSIRDRGTPNVKVNSQAQINEVITALRQPPEVRKKNLGVPVSTVVLDTVDEVARILIKERLSAERKETFAIADWGWLGDQLRGMIRALRNLDMHVVLTVHSKSTEDSDTGRTFVKPGIQGAMGDEIAGYVDLAVLLQARPVTKVVKGQAVREVQRYFQTYQDPIHPWVKDRSGQLPMEFPINFDDDFERLDTLIFGGKEARIAALAKVAADTAPDPVVVETPEPVVPEPEPEPVPEPEPEPVKAAEKETPEPPTPEPTPVAEEPKVAEPELEPEPVPDPGTAVENPTRHQDGTYSTDADAVAADCPYDYGCIIEKDMGDLAYIRFRKRLCRRCFAEHKAKKAS